MALYAASSARIFLKSCRVFVNYAHFSKIRKIYAFTSYFKFGKNTSIPQCNKQVNANIYPIYRNLKSALLYLFSENYKNLNNKKKKNSTRTPSWITEPAGQLGACVESCGKVTPIKAASFGTKVPCMRR